MVDQLERDIEGLAIRLLALRSPMAGDLREIVSALKISSDLERIGDYAASIARRSTRVDLTDSLSLSVYAIWGGWCRKISVAVPMP